jgi:hypothetical protein
MSMLKKKLILTWLTVSVSLARAFCPLLQIKATRKSCTSTISTSWTVPVVAPNPKGYPGDSTRPLRLSSENIPENREGKEEGKSLVVLFNDWGQSFQSRAQKSSAKSYQAKTRSTKFICALQSSCYYILFILYRGYRGFFVILPVVFRRVYAKLETAMETDLSLEDGTDHMSMAGSVSWRTRITVSVLATIVTFSYVLGGALRVATKFFRTVTKTSSVPQSFQAAADEIIEHEDRIRRIGNVDVNGEPDNKGSSDSAGLSP